MVAVAINAEIEEEARFEPQHIPLDIVYEDEDIIIINKPRDLVHPGAGKLLDGTAECVVSLLSDYCRDTACGHRPSFG